MQHESLKWKIWIHTLSFHFTQHKDKGSTSGQMIPCLSLLYVKVDVKRAVSTLERIFNWSSLCGVVDATWQVVPRRFHANYLIMTSQTPTFPDTEIFSLIYRKYMNYFGNAWSVYRHSKHTQGNAKSQKKWVLQNMSSFKLGMCFMLPTRQWWIHFQDQSMFISTRQRMHYSTIVYVLDTCLTTDKSIETHYFIIEFRCFIQSPCVQNQASLRFHKVQVH